MTKDREALLYVIDHPKEYNIKKSEATYKHLFDLFCDGRVIIGSSQNRKPSELINILKQLKVKYKSINTAPKGGIHGYGIALKDKENIEEIRLERLAVIDANIEEGLEKFKLECLYKFGKEKGLKAIEYFEKFIDKEWKLSKEFEEYLIQYGNAQNSKKNIHVDEPSHEIQAKFNNVEFSDIFDESFTRYLSYRIYLINVGFNRVQYRLPIWYERREKKLSEKASVPSFNPLELSDIIIEEDNFKIEEYSGMKFIPSGFKSETHSGYCQYQGERLSYYIELWIANERRYQYRLKDAIFSATYLKFDHPGSTAMASSLSDACKEAVSWGSFYEIEQRKKDEERRKIEQREEAVAKWQEENGYSKLESLGEINTTFEKQTIEKEEYEFPYYIRTIASYALKDNDKIRKLHIPFSVDKIEYNAFANMTNLEEVIIDCPIYSLPNYCFSGCIKLRKITFTEGLEIIWDSAFSGCVSLEKIKLPNSCRRIASWAFQDCKNLKEVIISPDAIIDKHAFRGCPCENEDYSWRGASAKIYFEKK